MFSLVFHLLNLIKTIYGKTKQNNKLYMSNITIITMDFFNNNASSKNNASEF